MNRAVVLHSRARPQLSWRATTAIARAAFFIPVATLAPALMLIVFAWLWQLYKALFNSLELSSATTAPLVFAVLSTAFLGGAIPLAVEWARHELSDANQQYSRWLEDEVLHLRSLERDYVLAMATKAKREEPAEEAQP